MEGHYLTNFVAHVKIKLKLVMMGFSALKSNWGKRAFERPSWLLSLPAGEEIVTSSKVPSDPPQLNSGHLENSVYSS